MRPTHVSRRCYPKLVVATGVAAALTACGGGSGSQAVHGQVLGGTQSAATVVGAMGGGTGICGGAVSGTQVIIKGPSGKLLATTNLRKDTAATRKLSLPATLTGQGQVGVYDFSATIPAGNGPYTIDLVGVNSTVVSAKQLRHLQLTCG